MPSTYSPSLKLELIQSGEQPGVWGNTTNKNLGTLLEQAITGTTSVDVTAGDVVLTSLNGLPDEARSATLYVFGTPGVTRVITIPDAFKNYTVQNATANIVQIKTAVGTAYDCPPLSHSYINCNDSDVVVGRSITNGANTITSNAAPFNSPAFTGTPTAPTATPGTNTTQLATTAFVTAAADTRVSSVTGTAPVVSSGGTTPVISMAAATGSVNGYLTSTDWNTFNNKTSNTGTVTSVGGTGTVNGISLSGTVTTSGNLTLGGTLDLTSPPAIGGTTAAAGSFTNLAYTGTLTGGTGVVNLGSNQLYKDASGRIGVGVVPRTDWVAGSTVIEFPSNHSIVKGTTNLLYTFSNLYLGTDGNYRFTGSSPGGYFYSGGGNFAFARSLYTATPDGLAVTTNMLSISQSTGIVTIGYADINTTTFGLSMYPKTDNYTSCGLASNRFTIVYATTGTINTSDARQKTPVRSLKDSEIAAAQELASEIGAFQWLEAVEKKGSAARLHIGITVQRAIEIMEKHSLDPFAYGFICFDAWEDIVNEDGVKTQEKGDVYSLRPDQLSLFIAKGQQVTMQNLSSQLDQMKVELAALKG